jgi:hypothetical protein
VQRRGNSSRAYEVGSRWGMTVSAESKGAEEVVSRVVRAANVFGGGDWSSGDDPQNNAPMGV